MSVLLKNATLVTYYASPQHCLGIGNITCLPQHFSTSSVSDAAITDLLTPVAYSAFFIFFSLSFFLSLHHPNLNIMKCSCHYFWWLFSARHPRAHLFSPLYKRESQTEWYINGGRREREQRKRIRREIWSNKPIMYGAVMKSLEEQPVSSLSRCVRDTLCCDEEMKGVCGTFHNCFW